MMIAGPNGAGKTTIASALISQQKNVYEEFLNADQIAQGLSPLNPRRYHRGLKHLISLYLPIANTAIVIDNSAAESGAKKIIAKKSIDTQLQIDDMEIWGKIEVLANV